MYIKPAHRHTHVQSHECSQTALATAVGEGKRVGYDVGLSGELIDGIGTGTWECDLDEERPPATVWNRHLGDVVSVWLWLQVVCEPEHRLWRWLVGIRASQ